MVALRGVAQTRHASRNRCRARVYAAGRFLSVDPFMYAYLYSTGGRTVSISQLALVLHSFLSYEGTAPEGIPFIHRRLSHRVLGHSNLPLRRTRGSALVRHTLTSLRLVYMKLRLRGVFDGKLEELYCAGKQHVRDCAHLCTCKTTTTTAAAATSPNQPRSRRRPRRPP